MIRVGSLFSGVGGIDLGLEWAGIGPVVWQVERDPWRRADLARHWPDVPRFDDVRAVGAATLERVDLVAGGFPCRGTSSAGLRTGLAHPESGLWYEFARVVRELRPGAVLVENPASGRRRWLAEARAELEAAGYATRDVGVSAREVGSPQFRPRTFLLAKPRRGCRPDGEGQTPLRAAADLRGYWLRRLGVPDGDTGRREARADEDAVSEVEPGEDPERRARDLRSRPASPEPRLGRVANGLSASLDGRGRWRWPATQGLPQHPWEAPKLRPAVRGDNRRRRVAALGDSCVPACAFVAALALIDWLSED